MVWQVVQITSSASYSCALAASSLVSGTVGQLNALREG